MVSDSLGYGVRLVGVRLVEVDCCTRHSSPSKLFHRPFIPDTAREQLAQPVAFVLRISIQWKSDNYGSAALSLARLSSDWPQT